MLVYEVVCKESVLQQITHDDELLISNETRKWDYIELIFTHTKTNPCNYLLGLLFTIQYNYCVEIV